MRNLRGVLAGALALIALETLVTSPSAPGRVSGLFGNVAELARRFADPTVPAFPDRGAKRKPLETPAAPAGSPTAFYPNPNAVPVPRTA